MVSQEENTPSQPSSKKRSQSHRLQGLSIPGTGLPLLSAHSSIDTITRLTGAEQRNRYLPRLSHPTPLIYSVDSNFRNMTTNYVYILSDFSPSYFYFIFYISAYFKVDLMFKAYKYEHFIFIFKLKL